MEFRTFGRTGRTVSEIGFGGWAAGGDAWGPQEDADSRAAIHRALDLGCTVLDTALSYGQGHSERLIGRVLAERGLRDKVFIATKVPPRNGVWAPPPEQPIQAAFPNEHIIASCEQSLRNLGVESIDLLQLHTWSRSWEAATEWCEAMDRLRRKGYIRSVGISVRDEDPGEANAHIRAGLVDAVQAVFNVLDQRAVNHLFPIAIGAAIAIIARSPLASGALASKWRTTHEFSEGDWRHEWASPEWLEVAVEQAKRFCGVLEPRIEPTIAALKFCLSFPCVSTVIPGMRNSRQSELNCSASDGQALPSALVSRVRSLFQEGYLHALPRVE